MRRAKAILVIVALLATPLALVARSANRMAGCAGMCCPLHGSHASRVLHEKMTCQHTDVQHIIECTMTSGHHGTDNGFIAPVAPTAPSATTAVGKPDVRRNTLYGLHERSYSGFSSAPFEPPRS